MERDREGERKWEIQNLATSLPSHGLRRNILSLSLLIVQSLALKSGASHRLLLRRKKCFHFKKFLSAFFLSLSLSPSPSYDGSSRSNTIFFFLIWTFSLLSVAKSFPKQPSSIPQRETSFSSEKFPSPSLPPLSRSRNLKIFLYAFLSVPFPQHSWAAQQRKYHSWDTCSERKIGNAGNIRNRPLDLRSASGIGRTKVYSSYVGKCSRH